MKTIEVIIGWENNYSAIFQSEELGSVLLTAESMEDVKAQFPETFDFHIEGMVSDGDYVPDYIKNKQYEFEYKLNTSAYLHNLDRIVTRAALSKVTGINERQLGHYAQGISKPRQEQVDKIKKGIEKIRTLLASPSLQ